MTLEVTVCQYFSDFGQIGKRRRRRSDDRTKGGKLT
jgi:hypothetical protein